MNLRLLADPLSAWVAASVAAWCSVAVGLVCSLEGGAVLGLNERHDGGTCRSVVEFLAHVFIRAQAKLQSPILVGHLETLQGIQGTIELKTVLWFGC
jgi:hypothetical protein